MLEHEPRALGVHPERLVVVVGAEVGGEVEEVGEVGREVAVVAAREADLADGEAEVEETAEVAAQA